MRGVLLVLLFPLEIRNSILILTTFHTTSETRCNLAAYIWTCSDEYSSTYKTNILVKIHENPQDSNKHSLEHTWTIQSGYIKPFYRFHNLIPMINRVILFYQTLLNSMDQNDSNDPAEDKNISGILQHGLISLSNLSHLARDGTSHIQYFGNISMKIFKNSYLQSELDITLSPLC